MRRICWIVLLVLAALLGSACSGDDAPVVEEFEKSDPELTHPTNEPTTTTTDPLAEYADCLKQIPQNAGAAEGLEATAFNEDEDAAWDLELAAGEVAVIPIKEVGSIALSIDSTMDVEGLQLDLPACYRAGESPLQVVHTPAEAAALDVPLPIVHYSLFPAEKGIEPEVLKEA